MTINPDNVVAALEISRKNLIKGFDKIYNKVGSHSDNNLVPLADEMQKIWGIIFGALDEKASEGLYKRIKESNPENLTDTLETMYQETREMKSKTAGMLVRRFLNDYERQLSALEPEFAKRSAAMARY